MRLEQPEGGLVSAAQFYVRFFKAQVDPDPYFFLEVINRGNEAVQDVDYFNVNGGQADITEFNYGAKVGQKFLNSLYNDNSGRRENISELETLGPSWDLLDSTRAIIFTI